MAYWNRTFTNWVYLPTLLYSRKSGSKDAPRKIFRKKGWCWCKDNFLGGLLEVEKLDMLAGNISCGHSQQIVGTNTTLGRKSVFQFSAASKKACCLTGKCLIELLRADRCELRFVFHCNSKAGSWIHAWHSFELLRCRFPCGDRA